MADAPRGPDPLDFPEAIAAPKSRRTVQLVWLVPLIAILIGAWLAGKAIFDRGPRITITFDTAEGLEAGKTKLKYKNVDVGVVKTVELSQDTKSVIVTAELPKQAEPYLRDDTRFWMVRARISGGTVTGLGTLLSGSYIGVDIGRAGKSRRDFIGLKQPPSFTSDTPGREFVLHTENIGSLDVGSPVYFRRLQAGQVTSYELDNDGKAVTINVFVNTPYDKFVNNDTRFWQSSGLDVSLDANGVKIDTQSIVSILIGGLVFETPLESAELPSATAKAQFHLFANRAAALKNPETDVTRGRTIAVDGPRVADPIAVRVPETRDVLTNEGFAREIAKQVPGLHRAEVQRSAHLGDRALRVGYEEVIKTLDKAKCAGYAEVRSKLHNAPVGHIGIGVFQVVHAVGKLCDEEATFEIVAAQDALALTRKDWEEQGASVGEEILVVRGRA